eukprot:Pgem_evm1s16262
MLQQYFQYIVKTFITLYLFIINGGQTKHLVTNVQPQADQVISEKSEEESDLTEGREEEESETEKDARELATEVLETSAPVSNPSTATRTLSFDPVKNSVSCEKVEIISSCFENWQRRILMQKTADGNFEKTVELPTNTKVLYK